MTPASSYFSLDNSFQAALIHRSYCNEHPGFQSNERLEFFGDAVLSLVISSRLYHLFPHLPEGELTARRSNLVQTSSLAAKAKVLRLDAQLKLSRGEEEGGGRNNPTLLANTFEAVLGALYLDSGLSACDKLLQSVFPDSEIQKLTHIKDPKSLLQEISQAKGWGTPTYHTVTATGPDHAKRFEVSVHLNRQPAATGTGTSKQRAETAAATAALNNLPVK